MVVRGCQITVDTLSISLSLALNDLLIHAACALALPLANLFWCVAFSECCGVVVARQVQAVESGCSTSPLRSHLRPNLTNSSLRTCSCRHQDIPKPRNPNGRIGVIGGSGLYKMSGVTDVQCVHVLALVCCLFSDGTCDSQPYQSKCESVIFDTTRCAHRHHKEIDLFFCHPSCHMVTSACQLAFTLSLRLTQSSHFFPSSCAQGDQVDDTVWRSF